MTIYLAPPTTGEATPVGGQLYRKQVLKKGPLRYKADGQDRTLNFDDEYMGRLVGAFRDRAYDSVPFVLADEKNRHTMDPERARGEVVDLEATPDGLDMLVRLSTQTASLVRENPNFGVSARIVEGLTRGDGKSWPVAMQHVLGTFDPRVTGMRPWESVNLAADGHDVIDLTDTQTGDADMAGLSDEELAALKQLAGLTPSLVGLVTSFDDDADGAEGYELDDDGAGELVGAGAGVVLSNEHTDGDLFDLSGTGTGEDVFGADAGAPAGDSLELSAMREELAGVQAELQAARWKAERDQLAASGVPPVMLDKAEILLSAPGTVGVINLSNGTTVDPARVIRDVLEAARGIVDLSAPVGHSQDQGDDAVVQRLHAEMDKMGDI